MNRQLREETVTRYQAWLDDALAIKMQVESEDRPDVGVFATLANESIDSLEQQARILQEDLGKYIDILNSRRPEQDPEGVRHSL
jgi:hypothetical protein